MDKNKNSMTRRDILLSVAAGATLAAAGPVAAQPVDTWPSAHPNLALKLMVFGRRRPGITLAEHRQHYRHVHGELVLRYIAAEPTAAPQRYVQNAVLDSIYRGTSTAGDPLALNRNFVSQIWFKDLAAMVGSTQTAFYKQHVQPDEGNFDDKATAVFVPTREREMWRRSAPPAAGSIKLFVLLQAAPGADVAAFSATWSGATARLQALKQFSAVSRYVQNDVLPPPGGASRLLHGIEEFWVDDEDAARALLAAWREHIVVAFERPGLVAPASSVLLLAREEVLHAGPR